MPGTRQGLKDAEHYVLPVSSRVSLPSGERNRNQPTEALRLLLSAESSVGTGLGVTEEQQLSLCYQYSAVSVIDVLSGPAGIVLLPPTLFMLPGKKSWVPQCTLVPCCSPRWRSPFHEARLTGTHQISSFHYP